MKIAEVRKLTPQERFLYWIEEREAIRLRKEKGKPKPWTDDEILQQYRFCNVRRMDDTVSQWFLKNWYEPFYGHKNMHIACCLARQFNNPESMGAIGFPERWDPVRVERILKDRAAHGLKNFNGAYMITGRNGGSKVTQVIDRFINPLVESQITLTTTSMHGAWKQLLGRPGFRSFLAGQVVADLRWATPGKWIDRLNWAPLGSGSLRGIHRLHNRWIAKPITEDQFLAELRAAITVGKEQLPRSITDRMEAMDWQSCLCEFDKYEREGRPKRKYNGA